MYHFPSILIFTWNSKSTSYILLHPIFNPSIQVSRHIKYIPIIYYIQNPIQVIPESFPFFTVLFGNIIIPANLNLAHNMLEPIGPNSTTELYHTSFSKTVTLSLSFSSFIPSHRYHLLHIIRSPYSPSSPS